MDDGLLSAVVSGALISNHDGIVGPWYEPKGKRSELPSETAEAMTRWSPDVRGLILNFELLEHLEFFANRWGAKNDPSVKIRIQNCRQIEPPTHKKGQLVKLERPTSETLVQKQLPIVRNYSDLRQDRAAEIISQADGFLDYFAGIGFLHPERTRWTLELLNALLAASFAIEMRLKHSMAVRRPVEFSGQINPMIPTPGHGSLPSGHATEAFLVAHVLAELAKGIEADVYPDPEKRPLRAQLMKQAARIATNRIIAGVHFPVDNAAGQVLGTCLANYFLIRAKGRKSRYTGWLFSGEKFGGLEHDWEAIDQVLLHPEAEDHPPFLSPRYVCEIHDAPMDLANSTPDDPEQSLGPLPWLWEQAKTEWVP